MAEEQGEKKVKFAQEFKCPHCGFMVTLESGKIILEKGTKSKFKEYTEVKKSEQSKPVDELENVW